MYCWLIPQGSVCAVNFNKLFIDHQTHPCQLCFGFVVLCVSLYSQIEEINDNDPTQLLWEINYDEQCQLKATYGITYSITGVKINYGCCADLQKYILRKKYCLIWITFCCVAWNRQKYTVGTEIIRNWYTEAVVSYSITQHLLKQKTQLPYSNWQLAIHPCR